MKKLDENEWKQIPIGKIFTNNHGKRLVKSKRKPGVVPLLTAGENNNGVAEFIELDGMPVYSSFISIDMFGNSFHHPYEATGDDNIYFFSNNMLSNSEKLFITTPIKKQAIKFSYGKQFRQKHANALLVSLPMINDEPDYKYMENYIETHRQRMLNQYKQYALDRVSELEYKKIPSLSEKEWEPFLLNYLFEIVRGRENNMKSLTMGNTPLISAKNGNNGLKDFVTTEKPTIPGNCISLNNDGDGGAGLAYYQPHEMALDSHVTALVPKLNINKYSMLFIAESISKLYGFFGHGLSISKKRANKIRIMLPVGESGQPDYEYMEQYAKNMMLKKYKQYLDYLKNKA